MRSSVRRGKACFPLILFFPGGMCRFSHQLIGQSVENLGSKGSVYSFSSSCPKTVSRTREVFPTGSTTLLRLQLSRTRDCAHRSRHVGFLFCFFFFWRERCLPKVSWKSNPAAPGLANQVWPFKSALCVPGKTLMVGWGLLAHASRGHLRWSVEGWACLSSFQLKGLYDRTRETHS